MVEAVEDRTLLSGAAAALIASGTTVNVAGVAGTKPGAIVAGFASFTDTNPSAAASDFQATINWGDGTSRDGFIMPVAGSPGFDVIGAHTFASEGSFAVTVTITDSQGDTATAQSTVTVQFPPSGTQPPVSHNPGGTTSGGTGNRQPTPPSSPTPAPPTAPPDATDAFLLTPISNIHSTPLAMHIHPHLTILINGQQQVIPANIGFTPDGSGLPIHTHDTSGTLHVESTQVLTFRLKDFFTIWSHTSNDPSIVFNSQDILGNRVDATHQITMTVNGQPSTAFENQVLNNPDGTLMSNGGIQIVISYGPR